MNKRVDGLSPSAWYELLLAVGVVLSVAGIVLAAIYPGDRDPGAGGALTVALSFASLWVRDNVGARLKKEVHHHDAEPEGASASDKFKSLQGRVGALEDALQWRFRESHRQNIALALTSVIGTLCWAFGSYAAQWLRGVL